MDGKPCGAEPPRDTGSSALLRRERRTTSSSAGSSETRRHGCCTSERGASSRSRSSSPLTKRRLLLSKTAIRQLERLPRDAERRVRDRLKVLEHESSIAHRGTAD